MCVCMCLHVPAASIQSASNHWNLWSEQLSGTPVALPLHLHSSCVWLQLRLPTTFIVGSWFGVWWLVLLLSVLGLVSIMDHIDEWCLVSGLHRSTVPLCLTWSWFPTDTETQIANRRSNSSWVWWFLIFPNQLRICMTAVRQGWTRRTILNLISFAYNGNNSCHTNTEKTWRCLTRWRWHRLLDNVILKMGQQHLQFHVWMEAVVIDWLTNLQPFPFSQRLTISIDNPNWQDKNVHLVSFFQDNYLCIFSFLTPLLYFTKRGHSNL